MTVEEMHYEFMVRFNSQSSEQQKSYLIPEVDQLLNNAMDMFINSKVYPRFSQIGSAVESTNRIIDDLRTIITTKNVHVNTVGDYGEIELDRLLNPDGVTPLDVNLKYLISAIAFVSCDGCNNNEPEEMQVNIFRHYDKILNNTIYNTSYNWKEIIAIIEDNKLKLYLKDPNYTTNLICANANIKFIRKPLRICNGANFGTGYYLGSVLCNTTDDCELPENTHNEIVDLAVMLAARNVSSSTMPIKQQSLQEQFTIN